MIFLLKGKSANVDNFAKKLEALVKEEADIRIPQRTTLSSLWILRALWNRMISPELSLTARYYMKTKWPEELGA